MLNNEKEHRQFRYKETKKTVKLVFKMERKTLKVRYCCKSGCKGFTMVVNVVDFGS